MLLLCSGLAGGAAWWMQPRQKAGVGARVSGAPSAPLEPEPSSRSSSLLGPTEQQIVCRRWDKYLWMCPEIVMLGG